MPDLFIKRIQVLFANVKVYNLSLDKNKVLSTKVNNQPGSSLKNPIDLDAGSKEEVNMLFNEAQAALSTFSP